MRKFGLFFGFLSATGVGYGVNIGSDSVLQAELNTLIQTPASETFNFTANVTLTAGGLPIALVIDNPVLLPINATTAFAASGNTLTINGGGFSLIAGTPPPAPTSAFRGFFCRSGTLNINNLTFDSLKAKGGDSLSGGGGAGLGGALFVHEGSTVNLTNVTFDSCSAAGGNTSGSGPGNSGASMTLDSTGSGGSGFGGTATLIGSSTDGGGGAGTNGLGGSGGDDFGGSQSGGNGTGQSAQTFGGGGGSNSSGAGGNGLFGGGGGEGFSGGAGGFGAGGGLASAFAGGFSGGAGGFGAGGGGSFTSGGPGGFGGGAGAFLGGAGAGFGGALFAMEGATVNFIDAVTFSGNSVSAGTSTGGGAGGGGLAAGTDIFMMSRAQVNFDLTTDLNLTSPIEGNLGSGNIGSPLGGGLTKSGPALMSLTGPNTYTGVTNVTEGELRINSSVTSDIEVNGGILSGNFETIANALTSNTGKLTLNSGRFCPGVAGVGTVTLAGAFEQFGGTFAVDVTPDPFADRVVVTAMGASIYGGDLEVIFGPGNYIAGTVYEVIQGPVTGNYPPSNIIKTGPTAELIDIQVTTGSLLITILNDRIFEDQVIIDGPAKAVASCLRSDTIPPGSDLALLVEYLGTLDNRNVNEALNEYSPAIFGSFDWVSLRNNAAVIDLISDHMMQLCCSKRKDCCSSNEIWIAGFGNFFNNKRKYDNLERFHSDSAGIAVGFDRVFCGDSVVGVAGGYTGNDLNYKVTDSQGSSGSIWGAVYASKECDFVTWDGAILAGNSTFKLGRRFNFSNVSRRARSRPKAQYVTAHAGITGNMGYQCFSLSPFLSLDFHIFNRRPFEESGGKGANLDVECKVQTFLRPELGLLGSYECNFGTHCFMPYFGVAWVGELPLDRSLELATFENQMCLMDVISYCRSNHLFAPQFGFKWTSCTGFSFMASYKGQFNRKTTANTFDARMEWIF